MGFSISFPADLEPQKKRKVLRLQLGKKYQWLENSIKNTCSNSLLEMLEVINFDDLKRQAADQKKSVNAYSLEKIEDGLKNNTGEVFKGIEGTYRGKTSDFFHHLFPYLEAFSPNFVTTLANKYAPDANILLDPFGGLGTAPFSFISGLSKQSYYCEVNPLMQHIAGLKSELMEVSEAKRKALGPRIKKMSASMDSLVNDQEIDYALDKSYKASFQGSSFFQDDTLAQVLKLRSLVDSTYCTDRLLGICLELSVLASLVLASDMQRAGDLRRKTVAERGRFSTNICDHVSVKLASFQDGILSFDTWQTAPKLLTEDSRKLNEIPYIGADIIITSPPYLNGTNYFRNTKIELWFIRVIRDKGDIGKLRDKAITAGINDVRGIRAKSNPPNDSFSSTREALSELDRTAYDKRIPQMVRWYSHDINLALQGAVKNLKPNGIIAVDIGDSVYSDVLVPTDELIKEILANHGCQLVENILVRKRKSRSGMDVKQVCIVAKKVSLTEDLQKISKLKNPKWSSFKSDLPHKMEPFSKRNWGHTNHSLCSYQGKLKPSIAKFLTDAFVPENGSVLDPFSGVGTIPFEAALQGKTSFGFDISPAAVAISRAKLSSPDREVLSVYLSELESYIESNKETVSTRCWLPGFNKNLVDYYDSMTLKEILCARDWFSRARPWSREVSLLLACCMHILHGNRPYALSRRSHPVTPFAPSGEFEYKSLIEKLNEKLSRVLGAEYPANFVEGKVFSQDITNSWPLEVDNLDAIITSPPFYDSTRFHLANWIRLWFSGWGEAEFNHEQKRFIDEKQKNSFDCYDTILRSSKERLKSGGTLVFHLGKSKKCDMAEELLKHSKHFFSSHELFNESVAHCESHGIRDKGTVTDHQYLVLY